MTFGVTSERNSGSKGPLKLQSPACHAPFLPSVGPNAGLFSTAILGGLEENIELYRLGSRCAGVRIHYLGVQPVALGQWHTSIYDSGKGLHASRICFKIAKSAGHQVVTDVSFSADDCDVRDYRYFNLGKLSHGGFSKFDDVVLLGGRIPCCSRSERDEVHHAAYCQKSFDINIDLKQYPHTI